MWEAHAAHLQQHPERSIPRTRQPAGRLTHSYLQNIRAQKLHFWLVFLSKARHYYQIIKKPMDLSVIRGRLKRSSAARYRSAADFVADVLLMFKNCAKFNYVSELLQIDCIAVWFIHVVCLCVTDVCSRILLLFHFLCENNQTKNKPQNSLHCVMESVHAASSSALCTAGGAQSEAAFISLTLSVFLVTL